MKPTSKNDGEYWWGRTTKVAEPEVLRIEWDEAYCILTAGDTNGNERDISKIEWLGPCPMPMSEEEAKRCKDLQDISARIKTQDNRITQHPMFCVQIKVRDVAYDAAYSDNKCWHARANEATIYDDDKDFAGKPEGDEWEEFGYRDRWETVMVSFTEGGCKEYLELNGHNDRRRAHNGEVRIYVESFRRCPEMIAIREYLMSCATLKAVGMIMEDVK
jgi:hypothetical protein